MNKLTVVQILPALDAGGVERCTLETARALVAAGHRSVVISHGGRLVAQLISEDSEHFLLPVHKKSWKSFFQIKPVRRILQRVNADILHARSRIPAWIAWLAWRKMPPATRPRFITTVHGMHSVSAYSAIMVKGEAVIAGSQTVRAYIESNYPQCAPENTHLISEGVSPDEFPYQYTPNAAWLAQWQKDFPELHCTASRKKIIFALPGRITRLKGHATFIALIKTLREKTNHDIHGLIIGGAEAKKAAYERELKNAVQREGLQDCISFTGHRSDMRDVLSQCDVVFSLSTQPETFGRTVLETLRLGRPVIAWDIGGVSEILQRCYPPGRVPVNNQAALVRACEQWLESPSVPAENTHFLLSHMCDETLALYQQLAEHRPL